MFKFKREKFPEQEKEEPEYLLDKYRDRRYIQPQDDAEALADRLRQDIQEKIDREQEAQIAELREDLEELEELLEKEREKGSK